MCGVRPVVNAIIKGQPGDLRDNRDDPILVTGDRPSERIQVGGWPPCVVSGEEHAALDDKLARI